MQKYILSIGLIVVGLLIGQYIRRQVGLGRVAHPQRVGSILRILQQVVLLGLNPIITLGAFWGASISDIRYIVIPFLGVLALVIGGILGFAASKIMRLDRKRAGSLFCAASFTNLGSFGTLVCFLFFGEAGYVIVSLYRLLEEMAYFLVGFPVAKRQGMGGEERTGRQPIVRILTDPFILVYLVCIAAGILLNLSGLDRPTFYPGLNRLLVPATSLVLVVTTGFNMKIGAIRGYLRECLTVSVIKFVATPVIITTLAFLAGLNEADDGLALRVVFVLSAMPPAFYSLIPPQIYKLDVDLANSCWLFNSGVFLLMIPVLYFIQGIL